MASTIRGSDNFDSAGGNAVKAWVNFNGTGTVAIRASYNVSSITDSGVGVYTANFTNSMADTSYAVTGSVVGSTGTTYDSFVSGANASLTTSSAPFQIRQHTGSAVDVDVVSVTIFR